MILLRILVLSIAITVIGGLYIVSKDENRHISTSKSPAEVSTQIMPRDDIATPPSASESQENSISQRETETDGQNMLKKTTATLPKISTLPIARNPTTETLPIPAPPTATTVTASDDTNTTTRNATVNILCTSHSGGQFRPISGSGIIIDPRGVILTNAHVAQYLLLEDYMFDGFMDCTARTESPARATYTIAPLYIPPHWVNKHAEQIDAVNPTATGESDYALLLITGRTDPTLALNIPLPFLNVQTSSETINVGDSVLIAGYPAGFLGGIATQKDLYLISTVTTIMKKFTFDPEIDNLDLISLGGNIVAQKGSSGGAVVDTNGDLIALVVTSTEGASTDDRDLRAVTLGHINRDLLTYKSESLSSMLSSDLRVQSSNFEANVAPNLTKLLTKALEE
jgi:S1-C subfamily serine protease